MTKVAKRKPQRLNKFIHEFSLLLSAHDLGTAGDILDDLLTPMEREMLAKRVQTAKMLLTGKKYHEIEDALNVQRSTIARMRAKLTLSATKALEKAVISKLPH